MERAELERLDRDGLILRAEALGVPRARILTRPELIDELILRVAQPGEAALRRARGFFGVARDLVARVVERGLHLPDAAERIRGVPIPARPRTVTAVVPTVTLAEIYASQGHTTRALETLRNVLADEPEHAAARTLLARLVDATYRPPPPPLPPEDEVEAVVAAPVDDEPSAAVAVPRVDVGKIGVAAKSPRATPAHPTPRADVAPVTTADAAPRSAARERGPREDVCVAIAHPPSALFVRWDVRAGTLAHRRAALGDGDLALRLLVIEPTWDGPRSSVRDVAAGEASGAWIARDLPAGATVRVAVGWRSGARFVPIAHSPALAVRPAARGDQVSVVRCTAEGDVPVVAADPDADRIARALDAARTSISAAS